MIYFAITLIVAGYSIRIWAIYSLGESFTLTIAVPDSINRSGPYKWVRHPAYTGNLIAMIGIVMVSVPVAVLLVSYSLLLARAVTEEACLSRDPDYPEYFKETGRFMPQLNLKGK